MMLWTRVMYGSYPSFLPSTIFRVARIYCRSEPSEPSNENSRDGARLMDANDTGEGSLFSGKHSIVYFLESGDGDPGVGADCAE